MLTEPKNGNYLLGITIKT